MDSVDSSPPRTICEQVEAAFKDRPNRAGDRLYLFSVIIAAELHDRGVPLPTIATLFGEGESEHMYFAWGRTPLLILPEQAHFRGMIFTRDDVGDLGEEVQRYRGYRGYKCCHMCCCRCLGADYRTGESGGDDDDCGDDDCGDDDC